MLLYPVPHRSVSLPTSTPRVLDDLPRCAPSNRGNHALSRPRLTKKAGGTQAVCMSDALAQLVWSSQSKGESQSKKRTPAAQGRGG